MHSYSSGNHRAPEMNRNSTNQYGCIGSGILTSNRTPQSAVDVDDSPMFYYKNSNSNEGISSQNSEDVKVLKSIQKKSKRRLNMDEDEEIEDGDDQILFRKPPNLNFDQKKGLDQEMVTPLQQHQHNRSTLNFHQLSLEQMLQLEADKRAQAVDNLKLAKKEFSFKGDGSGRLSNQNQLKPIFEFDEARTPEEQSTPKP